MTNTPNALTSRAGCLVRRLRLGENGGGHAKVMTRLGENGCDHVRRLRLGENGGGHAKVMTRLGENGCGHAK